MRNSLIGPIFFILQLWLSFYGQPYLGKYGNPFALLIVSMAIPVWYIYRKTQAQATERSTVTLTTRVLWGLLGIAIFALSYEETRKLWVEFAVPRDFSDVLPQLETLYQRFHAGIFPYAPVDMGSYQPYPVYMPLHWLPIGFSQWLQIDTRWVGYGFLGIAIGLLGFALAARAGKWWQIVPALMLPALPLWAFILGGRIDIGVSFELIIAAYYLVLAVGLLLRNPWLTGAGLIGCLLSRYTLAFWLPQFALLLWIYAPRRQSYLIWGSVALAFTGLYFVPFFLHDPSILSKGLAYHNEAAVGEWTGYGDQSISWSFERGIYFAPHLKALFSGSMEHRVTLARVVQGSLMLALCFGGFFFYQRKLRQRMVWQDYSLAMLYLIMAAFYFFGPLTYRYYLIVLFMLSAAICADGILGRSEKNAG